VHSCERKGASSLWEVPILWRRLLHLLRHSLGCRGRKGEGGHYLWSFARGGGAPSLVGGTLKRRELQQGQGKGKARLKRSSKGKVKAKAKGRGSKASKGIRAHQGKGRLASRG
jgi:hypothetical protein